MKECSKSIHRRLADSSFVRRYFVGTGIDIGGKPDPLMLYRELFPLMKDVRTWDWEDGDAQHMKGVPDRSVDFIHSSHCLEHLVDPQEGLRNWLRVVREGGHLVVMVPDEDLYEQGTFPSTFNRDHKWTFTVLKHSSWSDRSLNVVDLVRGLGPEAELLRVEQLGATYRYGLPRVDQTLSPVAECAIEFVVRRRPAAEVQAKGRWQRTAAQPDRETRIHLNQYAADQRSMKEGNRSKPPFTDDSPIA